MRKFFVLFAALVCASAMFAQLEFGSNRCLVAYFSATGNTRAVATMLSQIVGDCACRTLYRSRFELAGQTVALVVGNERSGRATYD